MKTPKEDSWIKQQEENVLERLRTSLDNYPWIGSNSTDLMMFIDKYCDKCTKQPISPDAENQCNIQMRMMAYGINEKQYPKQIVEDGKGFGKCTSFVNREEYNKNRKVKIKDNINQEKLF